MDTINIKLTEDAKCVVVRNGEEETVKHPKGTVFFDVCEINYDDEPSEWQHLDDDMVSTFIPMSKAAQLQ